MAAVTQLPEGYRETEVLNLQSNKKTALLIQVIAIVIMVIMMVGMNLVIPFTDWLDSLELKQMIVRLAVMAVGYVLYIIAHELTHGVFMKLVGGQKVKYGFTGMYAFAGSEQDYFDRTSYIKISLAPLVIWGIVFVILQIILPESWLWVVWFWQMGNVSGAAGDMYVTWKTLHRPETVLVRDTGIDMTYYEKEN